MSRLALIVNTIMDAENIDLHNLTREDLYKKITDLRKLIIHCQNLYDRLLLLEDIAMLNKGIEESKKSFYGIFLSISKGLIKGENNE